MSPAFFNLHLRRCDPARNMARFYRLSIVTDLFGSVLLLREWGRIGTRGRSLSEDFGDAGQATARLKTLARAKRRRGYVDVAA